MRARQARLDKLRNQDSCFPLVLSGFSSIILRFFWNGVLMSSENGLDIAIKELENGEYETYSDFDEFLLKLVI